MNVTLVLFTYSPSAKHPRSEYGRATLNAALLNTWIGDHTLSVHIADDGSDPEYIESLIKMCEVVAITPTYTNAERGGYGRSYNLATQMIHRSTDFVLCLEDDWELTKKLDLASLIDSFQDGRFGCIRLGYIGFTQPLRGEFIDVNGHIYFLFDPESPEIHVWAGHPRLETVEWQKYMGEWPEELSPGDTEFIMSQKNRKGVVWPSELILSYGGLFVHTGAVRSTEERIVNAN